MYNLFLFLIKPNRFYEKLRKGELIPFVTSIITIYSILYILWAIEINPIFTEHYSLFYHKNLVLHSILSLIIDIAIIFGLSLILCFIAKLFGVPIKFFLAFATVFSVEIISIILMLAQLVIFYIFDNIGNVKIWKTTGSFCQIFYLILAIKNTLLVSNIKAIVLAISTSITMLVILLTIFFTKISLYPDNEIQKGIQYLNTHNYDSAISFFKAAIDGDPNNPIFYLHLGDAYRFSSLVRAEMKKESLNKAKRSYILALELDPNLLKARIGLGLVYAFVQQYEDALDEFEIVISNEPNRNDIYREMGKIYIELGDPQTAKKYFELALDGKFEKEISDKTRKFDFRIKVSNRNANQFHVNSKITWRVSDPVLYIGTIDNIETAESRIYDVCYAIIMKNLQGNIETPFHINYDNKLNLLSEFNKSILTRKFGIMIESLDMSAVD